MEKTNKKQHFVGLLMLSAVAIFWGAGFVLNAQLMDHTFADAPSLLNALRFGVSALCLLAVFNKRVKFRLRAVLYGAVGGALLFGGFLLQLIALKYTTPSHNGFFTAFYVVLVPFVAWIIYRRCPHWTTFVGAALAIGGLLILNFAGKKETGVTWKGDLLTLACAMCFALQIVWADYVLKSGKTDYVQLTFWQVATAAILFVLYTVIFESKRYAQMNFDAGYDLWRLAIVVLGGTAFAYYAQTFAQTRLSPSEASLIMACESPIGAALSVAVGLEPLQWSTVVGGVMVVSAVVLVEILPNLLRKKGRAVTPNDDKADDPPPDCMR